MALVLVAGCSHRPAPPTGSSALDAPESQDTAEAERPHPADIDWAAAGDCRAQLDLLRQRAAEDRLGDDQTTPFVIMTAGGGLDWRTTPVDLVRDLPIQVDDGRARAPERAPDRAPDRPDAACVIRIDAPSELAAGHQVVDYEEVASVRQSGTRSGRNPEYDAAKQRARRAEGRLKRADSSLDRVLRSRPIRKGTDDFVSAALELMGYALDGVTFAFQGRAEEAELEDALSDLAELKSSEDRAVYRPYTFERQLVRAGREATFDLELRDLGTGRVWRSRLRQREVRQLTVVEGLDPGDRDFEVFRGGSFSPRKLKHWQRQPPALPLSAVVASLLDTDSAMAPEATPPPRSTPEIAPPGPQRNVPAPPPDLVARTDAVVDAAAPDDRPDPDSAVWVAAKGGGGPGVYVRPYVVLTGFDRIRGAAVVDVIRSDGRTALGLVIRTDPARTVALIHVPRAGTPAALHPSPAPGQTLRASVLIARGPERADVARGELAAEVGGALRIALASAPDRNLRGAPVFIGAALVGLLADSTTGPDGWSVTPLAPVAPLIDDRRSGPQTARQIPGG